MYRDLKLYLIHNGNRLQKIQSLHTFGIPMSSDVSKYILMGGKDLPPGMPPLMLKPESSHLTFRMIFPVHQMMSQTAQCLQMFCLPVNTVNQLI